MECLKVLENYVNKLIFAQKIGWMKTFGIEGLKKDANNQEMIDKINEIILFINTNLIRSKKC